MCGGGIPHSRPEPRRRLSRACVISFCLHKTPTPPAGGWGRVRSAGAGGETGPVKG